MSAKTKYRYPDNFPVDALEQHVAIVGKTGSGKTYAAKTLVEPMLAEGRRVCIIDPTGAWYGLRSSADGKSPGYPVVVFGGDHADVPISKGAGVALAEIIGGGTISAVIDLSEMLIGERHTFMVDFAAKLYGANKKRPLQLVIDEADEFAPQSPMPEIKRMMHQIDRIVRRGRIQGFRVMLITQRPAVLHKNVLTQANTLIAMRLTAPQDRKALMEWVKGQADEQEGKSLIDGLPTLKPGEGWIWAPEFDVLCQVTFPRIRTLDTSRAPTGDEDRTPPTLASIDVAAIEAQLGDVIAEAAANDPKVLRRRIAELEREAKTRKTPAAAPAPTPQQLVAEYERGLAVGKAEGLAKSAQQLGELDAPLREIDRGLHDLMEKMSRVAHTAMVNGDKLAADAQAITKRTRLAPPPRPSQSRAAEITDSALTGPQQKILDGLAWCETAGIKQPTRVQTAFASGYSPKGSAFTNPLGALRTAGLVEYPDSGHLRLTEEGRNRARYPEQIGHAGELQARVLERLRGPERKILRPILGAYPDMLDRETVAERSGYSPNGSAFTNPLGRLRSLGLITYPDRGHVCAAAILFP